MLRAFLGREARVSLKYTGKVEFSCPFVNCSVLNEMPSRKKEFQK